MHSFTLLPIPNRGALSVLWQASQIPLLHISSHGSFIPPSLYSSSLLNLRLYNIDLQNCSMYTNFSFTFQLLGSKTRHLKHLQIKGGEIYFGSQFSEDLVHGWLQGRNGMVVESSSPCGSQEVEKGGTRDENTPFLATAPVTCLFLPGPIS